MVVVKITLFFTYLSAEGLLDYLVANVENQLEPSVVLFSLIALEKFAQTSKYCHHQSYE